MQIYALDKNLTLLSAAQAIRGISYQCPECRKEVRVRGGKIRQSHFYHLVANPCSLHGKSLIHMQIQWALKRMLEGEEIFLEHRFPEIGRIADLFWPSKKLVFEVQVSPISAIEVRERNRDYLKAGYQLVWILHDKRFNRVRLTPAEISLRCFPHYFTNINEFGKGFFYDQYAFIRFKRRKNRSLRMKVSFKYLIPIAFHQLSRQFPQERKKWPFSFAGDLFNQPMTWQISTWQTSSPPSYSRFHQLFQMLFHHLLEKTTY